MERLARWIVKERNLILALAIVLLIPATYGLIHLEIEYDLLSYMPDDLPSVQGLKILEKDFGYGARAIVTSQKTPDWQVQKLKEKLEQVPGVSQVFWISDFVDPAIPHEYLGEELTSQFYRGDLTVLEVNFKENASSPITEQGIEEIKKLITPKQKLVGELVSLLELKELAMREKPQMVWCAIGLLFLVLFLALPSYIMPLLFMATLGLSVVYTLGLNFFIGRKVSYITGAVTAALQLGVTMDFCIFLVHSFQEECLASTPEEAMVGAITKTARAVISSALTTAVGFATLSVMRIKLGADLGLTLAFGVVISVVMALTVLPALIFIFREKIDKYQHKSIIPSFEKLSPKIVQHRQGLFIVFAVGLVLSYIGYSKVELSFDVSDSFPDSLQSITTLKELKPKLGAIETAYLVSQDVPVWKLEEITGKLEKLPAVSKVSSLDQMIDPAIPEEFAPPLIRDRFVQGNWRNTILNVKGGSLDPEMVSFVEKGKKLVEETEGTIYFTGQPVLTNDSKAISTKDSKLVDSLSLLAIFLIVGLAFASFGVPVVLLAIIQLAIWFNQALVYCSGKPMFFFARLAIGAIQLGATVDYAILMTNTFKEERKRAGSLQAMESTINKSCPAILNSGLALFAATCGVYLTSSLKVVQDLSLLLARGALISMVVVCFLLPAVLLISEVFLKKTSRSWPDFQKE